MLKMHVNYLSRHVPTVGLGESLIYSQSFCWQMTKFATYIAKRFPVLCALETQGEYLCVLTQ